MSRLARDGGRWIRLWATQHARTQHHKSPRQTTAVLRGLHRATVVGWDGQREAWDRRGASSACGGVSFAQGALECFSRHCLGPLQWLPLAAVSVRLVLTCRASHPPRIRLSYLSVGLRRPSCWMAVSCSRLLCLGRPQQHQQRDPKQLHRL